MAIVPAKPQNSEDIKIVSHCMTYLTAAPQEVEVWCGDTEWVHVDGQSRRGQGHKA